MSIGSKWVFRNKDDHGTVIRIKARLVALGFSQEEGIDYNETFAPVARMESIGIFLAYETYMNFIIFHMDVKSAFQNGKVKEEAYVKQLPSFKSSEFPDYVCKLDKALYGLEQAPKISVQSKRILPHSCEENLHVPEGCMLVVRGKLVCWSAKKQQSMDMPLLKLNMLLLLDVLQLSDESANIQRHLELWCIFVVDLPKPPSHEQEPRLVKESIIKFTVKTGNTPLSFNFKTFVQTTRLYYNNGQYEALPLMEVMKADLLKLGLYNEKSGRVLGGNKSSTDQLNSSQQMIVYSLLTRAKIDIGDIILNYLVTSLIDKPKKKYVAYPRFLSCVLKHLLGLRNSPPKDGTRKSKLLPKGNTTDPKDSEGNKQPADKGFPFTSDERMANYILCLRDHLESSKEKKHKKSNQSPGRSDSGSSSCFETFKTYDNYVPVTERVLERNLQGFSKIITQFKTDHIEGINKILTNFKEVQDAVKEDLALNKKVLEAAEAYTKNSSTLLKLLNLVKDLEFLVSKN
ncbi:retrovirus-related pol polyprotein from transposon TNT 1-94 [Tanacetum coccineum]